MTIIRLFQTRSIRWALISAVLAGITAYLTLQYAFLQKSVVVADRRIEAGVPIKKEWLRVKELPEHSVTGDTFDEIDSVVGKRLRVTRIPEDLITGSCIEKSKGIKTKKPGYVIVSLNVRDYQPLSSYVARNSVINIVAVEQSMTLDKNPSSTVIKSVKLIEARKIVKNQNLQKADTALLLEVPLDLAEKLIALESGNYFKIVIDEGG